MTDFLAAKVQELLATDLAAVRFGSPEFGVLLSAIVAGVILFTLSRLLLWPRRHSRHHSGYSAVNLARRSLGMRVICHLPKLPILAAMAVVLLATADPFLANVEVDRNIESRVRIDLVDTSSSMGYMFDGSRKVKAEIARDAHLDFLKLREGQQDRVSMWLFSAYPYMIDDFVTDDELYYFQAWDAPYVTITNDTMAMIPDDKVWTIRGEGSTNIVRALQAVIRHFDADAAATGRDRDYARAVLIITDANVQTFPEDEMDELVERNITPYMIYINYYYSRPESRGSLAPRMVEMVREHGGEYFGVGSADGLKRAYEAIDALEAQQITENRRVVKIPIYDRFLLASLALLLVGIPAGFLTEALWGVHP